MSFLIYGVHFGREPWHSNRTGPTPLIKAMNFNYEWQTGVKILEAQYRKSLTGLSV